MPTFVLSCRVEGAPDEELRKPNATALAAAIHRLDGDRYSDLSLSLIDRAPDEAMDPADLYNALHGLIVGGSPDRVRLTYIPDIGDTQRWWYLAEPERGDAIEERVLGGQGAELPARLWVTHGAATRAALHYLEHQDRDLSLTWELDPNSEDGAP